MSSLVKQEEYDFQTLWNELKNFITWIANQKRSDIWLMDQEELVGELSLKMYEVWLHYHDSGKTLEQMKAIIRRSLDNCISDLYAKYGRTHRVENQRLLSFEEFESDDSDLNLSILESRIVMNIGATVVVDVTELYDSQQNVDDTYVKLSTNAKRVFCAVINGDPILEMHIKLSGIRANVVYQNGGTVKVKPFHVANALGLTFEEAKMAFEEIRQVYKEVCNDITI